MKKVLNGDAGDRESGDLGPRTLMRLRTALAFGLLLAARLVHAAGIESAAVDGDGIRLEFDSRMRSRVVATFAGETALGPFEESETLLTATGALGDFALESREEAAVSDALGDGRRVTLTGHAGRIAKRVEVTAYAARPRWLFVSVRYINEGDAPLAVTGWTSHRYVFDAVCATARSRPSGRTRAAATRSGPTGCCRSRPASRSRTSSA